MVLHSANARPLGVSSFCHGAVQIDLHGVFVFQYFKIRKEKTNHANEDLD